MDVPAACVPHRLDQAEGLERLAKVGDRARLLGARPCDRRIERGNEDERRDRAALRQPFPQLEAADAWQVDIEYQAAGGRVDARLEQGLRGRIGERMETRSIGKVGN